MTTTFFTFAIVQAAWTANALKSTQGWQKMCRIVSLVTCFDFPDVTFATLQEDIHYCPEWRFGLYTTRSFIVQMNSTL